MYDDNYFMRQALAEAEKLFNRRSAYRSGNSGTKRIIARAQPHGTPHRRYCTCRNASYNCRR